MKSHVCFRCFVRHCSKNTYTLQRAKACKVSDILHTDKHVSKDKSAHPITALGTKLIYKALICTVTVFNVKMRLTLQILLDNSQKACLSWSKLSEKKGLTDCHRP